MEHRIGKRIPISLEVELWRDRRKFGCYTADNIGRGGMFVKQCEDAVVNNEFLTAKIKRSAFSGSLEAMVVHKSDAGAGLMWVHNNAKFLAALEDRFAMTE